MIMKNSTFDTLKWISMILIPALVTLILTVGKIWSLPYYGQIGATVAALGVFLGALLRVSNNAYNKTLIQEGIDVSELEAMGGEDDEN